MREWFQSLSLEEKRNEINKETISLVLLVNKIVSDEKMDYFNYNPNDLKKMNEEEFLTEEYLQVIEARKKLINVFN